MSSETWGVSPTAPWEVSVQMEKDFWVHLAPHVLALSGLSMEPPGGNVYEVGSLAAMDVLAFVPAWDPNGHLDTSNCTKSTTLPV